MRYVRNRLLILLVLLAAAVAWTNARAATRYGTGSAATATTIAKPGVAPATGDPDVGQSPYKPPVTTAKSLRRAWGWTGQSIYFWLQWGGRVWVLRYPGAR